MCQPFVATATAHGSASPGSAAIDPLRHTPLVLSIAKTMFRGTLPFSDLVQEGMVGLLQAIRRYDPRRAKFGWYARRKIRWVMLRAIEKHMRSQHVVLNGEHDGLGSILARYAPSLFSRDIEIALTVLTDRERSIVCRWAGRCADGPHNCADIARQDGITKQRVNQILHQSLRKMRNVLGIQRAGGSD